ncbi:MAG: CBS domain-containing protein [Candidatus Methanofastidiosa archaeon]|nr:CBS domain-containing protein [Candidatus Methanofastidiosa archaeon]
MSKILIEDIMNNDILIMGPDDSLVKAVKKMQEKNSDYVLVSNDRYPEGIVTERDVITKVLSVGLKPDKVKLKDIMKSPVMTIEKKLDVKVAWESISESKIKRLIVTESEKAVGVITAFDILSVAPELFEAEEGQNNPEGGFCEFCGSYFPSLNMVEGKYVCDSCKDQLLEE